MKDYEFEYEGKTFTIEKGLNLKKRFIFEENWFWTFLGRSFIIPIHPIHRDPLYYPEPMKFDPERFSDENKSKIDPDTYMPFGKLERRFMSKKNNLILICL